LLQIDLIHQRYTGIGGPGGPLGYPTSEVRFDTGNAIREYRGGDIRILGKNVPAIARQEVTITFLGFRCIEESTSDQVSSSDEPYFVITIDDGTRTPTVRKFGRFENVDKGTEIGFAEVVIKGVPPNIMGLRVLAYENDFGDPDETAKKVQETVVVLSQQAGTLASGAAAADGPGVGPAAAAGTVGGIAAGPIGALVAAGLVTALGLGDDFVGQSASSLFSRSEDVGTKPTIDKFQNNDFNHQIHVDGGDNGVYEFFFDIKTELIEPPRTI